jgi:glycosyltransferase involved in cell wall biosynthesis
MKIIRLSTFLDFGGVEKRLANVSAIKDDNEWIFCAINIGGQAEGEIKNNDKKVICLNLPYKIPNLKTLLKIYKFFKKQQPDVVHTSGAEANFYGVLAAKLAGVPKIVAEEIGTPSQSALGKLIFRFIFKISNYVVGNSLPVINYLKEKNKVSDKKLSLIPNPILFKELSKRKNHASIFKLISVSRLEKVKNIQDVLYVVKRLKKEGIKIEYDIIGSGSEEITLRNQVEALKLKNEVNFLGFISNPYPHLLHSDLYIINSFTEGFSNSLVEAMYSGTPSLSSKSGSAEEIIIHGKNGWLVEVANQDHLFSVMKEIIEFKPTERLKIGLAGKKMVEENYSLDSHIEKLMSIYEQ